MNSSFDCANTNADSAMFEDGQDMSEDWPYCECGEQATEDEEAGNCCACCGKPLC